MSTPQLGAALDLYQSFEVSRRHADRLGPALPGALLAAVAVAFAVAMARRVVPPRARPWIPVALEMIHLIDLVRARPAARN